MGDPHLSDASGDLQHFLLDVLSYNADGDRSYLRLGDWNPFDDEVIDDEAFERDGDLSKVSVSTLGDDLLAAFIDNPYRSEVLDRDDPGADTRDSNDLLGKAGFTDYARLATPPDEPSNVEEAGYSYAQRVAMTNSTPAHVGWRDHTEGHRITTTRGDKIEVIGGNYKLVVLGRGHGTARTDWSGGLMTDSLEAQGNVTSINYRQVPVLTHDAYADDGIDDADTYSWQWVEETIKGHVIERFHGTKREEFYGDELITIVGRAPMDDGSDRTPLIAADKESKGAFARDMVYDGTVVPTWDEHPNGEVDVKLMRPHVLERIHAQSVFSVEKIEGSKVDVETASRIHDYVGCAPDLDDDRQPRTRRYTPDFGRNPFDDMVRGKAASGSWEDRPQELFEVVKAVDVSSAIEVDEMLNSVGGHDGASASLYEKWLGNFMEYFDGDFTQYFVGASTTLGLANRAELFIGSEQNLNLGGCTELCVALAVPAVDAFFGLEMAMGVGMKDDKFVEKSKTALSFSWLGAVWDRTAAASSRTSLVNSEVSGNNGKG